MCCVSTKSHPTEQNYTHHSYPTRRTSDLLDIRSPLSALQVLVDQQLAEIGESKRILLREAIAQLAKWQQKRPNGISTAINLSPFQIQDLNLVPFIHDLIAEQRIMPGHVTLEITETALLHEDEMTLKTLNRLKRMGVLLS